MEVDVGDIRTDAAAHPLFKQQAKQHLGHLVLASSADAKVNRVSAQDFLKHTADEKLGKYLGSIGFKPKHESF